MLRSEDVRLDIIDGWGHGYLFHITYLSTSLWCWLIYCNRAETRCLNEWIEMCVIGV